MPTPPLHRPAERRPGPDGSACAADNVGRMGIGELDREAHVPEGRPRGTAGSPRTLAEALRARGDDGLAALLRARPDLLGPVPNDLTQLATRAGTRASVVR